MLFKEFLAKLQLVFYFLNLFILPVLCVYCMDLLIQIEDLKASLAIQSDYSASLHKYLTEQNLAHSNSVAAGNDAINTLNHITTLGLFFTLVVIVGSITLYLFSNKTINLDGETIQSITKSLNSPELSNGINPIPQEHITQLITVVSKIAEPGKSQYVQITTSVIE